MNRLALILAMALFAAGVLLAKERHAAIRLRADTVRGIRLIGTCVPMGKNSTLYRCVAIVDAPLVTADPAKMSAPLPKIETCDEQF